MNQKSSKFISFEGGEGSGKTTQIGLFVARLEKFLGEGQVVRTREPGGSPFANKIRSILVDASDETLAADTQALLLYAARSEHLREIILPALHENKWVVTDRFSDSTSAYQGYALGVEFEFLNQLEARIVGSNTPDLTIFLDIDPEIGLNRAFSRNDNETKYESLGLAFHQKLYEGFKTMIAKNPDRFIVINADQSIEAVHEAIWEKAVLKLGLQVS